MWAGRRGRGAVRRGPGGRGPGTGRRRGLVQALRLLREAQSAHLHRPLLRQPQACPGGGQDAQPGRPSGPVAEHGRPATGGAPCRPAPAAPPGRRAGRGDGLLRPAGLSRWHSPRRSPMMPQDAPPRAGHRGAPRRPGGTRKTPPSETGGRRPRRGSVRPRRGPGGSSPRPPGPPASAARQARGSARGSSVSRPTKAPPGRPSSRQGQGQAGAAAPGPGALPAPGGAGQPHRGLVSRRSAPSSSCQHRRQVSYWARAALRCPLRARSSISCRWASSRHGSSASRRRAAPSPASVSQRARAHRGAPCRAPVPGRTEQLLLPAARPRRPGSRAGEAGERSSW